MKKIFAVLLILSLALSLCACEKTPEQLYAEGIKAVAEGKYAEAARYLEKFLEQEPENTEVLSMLADAKYASGDNEGFLSAYNKLSSLGADTAPFYDKWLEATNYEVVWADKGLESCVREYLGKRDGVIYRNDLNEIGGIYVQADLYRVFNVGVSRPTFDSVYFEFSSTKQAQEEGVGYTKEEYNDGSASLWYYTYLGGTLSSIEDCKHFVNLEMFGCVSNPINDISLLADLTNLKYLKLNMNGINDITPLAGLTNLTELDLSYNPISDIAPLAGLTNLTKLYFSVSDISDIAPLAELTNLTELTVKFNNGNISDITPLSGLTNLTYLELNDNNITDITPLAGLTNLTSLHLSYNKISDLSPLAGLINLTTLNIMQNKVSDITPLAELTNLTELWLGFNDISDIRPLAELTNLKRMIIFRNNIGNGDAEWLKSRLPHCNIRF